MGEFIYVHRLQILNSMRKLTTVILILISFNVFSTNYYWKNVNGNSTTLSNYATDTTSWTTALAFPTSSDNLYFTYAAGNVTCTITGIINCLDWNCHGFRGTVVGNGTNFNVNIYGNVYLSGTMPITASTFLMQNASSATWYSNGISIGNFYKSGGSAEIKIMDNLSCIGMRIAIGTINLNGKPCTIQTFAISDATNPSTLITGAANVNFSANGAIDFATNGSNFTFTGTGSTLRFTAGNPAFKGNGKTFENVYLEGTLTTGGMTISGNNTFTTLGTNSSVTRFIKFTDGSTQTVTNLSINGTPGNRITLTGTGTAGWAITKSTGITRVSFCNISYSTATGGEWMAGSNSTSQGFNSGWKFLNSLLFSTGF